MVHRAHLITIAALVLLGLSSPTLAHEHGDHMANPLELEASSSHPTTHMNGMTSSVASPQSYFAYPEHSGLLGAHVILMVIAWFFILPIEVVLSIARSPLVLPSQLSFLAVNGLGLMLGRIHHARVPNLYEGNMHSPLGWALSAIMLLQCVIGAVQIFASVGVLEKTASDEEKEVFLPISVEAMAQHQAMHRPNEQDQFRFSRDSGQGTEPEFSSSCSVASLEREPRKVEEDTLTADGDGRSDDHARSVFRWMLRGKSRMRSSRMLRIVTRLSDLIDLVILPLGFVAVISGLVIYGGVFRGRNVFNGLAHTIKGGIFFWYGLLTLGRWMGCMVEYGWAWNVRPPVRIFSSRKWVPSAEFVESFVIFLYGSTNVFLEHLAAWGGAWTAQDLEHVSISIMFFGGGLCGMLIESQYIRRLLNATIMNLPAKHGHLPPPIDRWAPPKTYPFSLNPFPALIILLLGLMMSSHHQASSVSTMIHKQWGTLFVAFALARALTYILTYISPPQSFLPSRPPTEIVTSFCLISGGIIFMLSNKDTVAAMDGYELDAMFSFTVTMGFTAFLMAWTIIVLAVKGWAVGRG